MKNFGEFFNNQIEHASSIILSHTAGLSQDKLDACVALMREHNQEATIVTTPWEEITGQQILATMEQKNTIAAELAHLEEEAHDHEHHHHHHHGHDADEVFVSWGAETARKFTEAEINEMLAGLDSLRYGQVVRAKGYVASDGEDWIYFDYVPGERELRRGAPAVTGRLCVIGSGLDEEGLKELFKLG